MAEALILVTVPYPLCTSGVRTLHRAIQLRDQIGDGHLVVLHINLRQKGEYTNQEELVRAVRQTVGRLEGTSYHVRSTFFLEEAILYEATQQEADYVVIGKTTRGRWRRALSSRLGLAVDLESFLRRHLDSELVVV